eukprot:3197014-Rhodomonas_salina.2
MRRRLSSASHVVLDSELASGQGVGPVMRGEARRSSSRPEGAATSGGRSGGAADARASEVA